MTFVASPRKRSVGCVYAGRCVYAPDAAFTPYEYFDLWGGFFNTQVDSPMVRFNIVG